MKAEKLKSRPKKYQSIEEIEYTVSEAIEGQVARLRTIDLTCSVIVVNVDLQNRELHYESIGYLYKNLKHKIHKVKFDRIIRICPIKFHIDKIKTKKVNK